MIETQTILYVDDEPLNLMLFEANLEDVFDVRTAESGRDGLEILSQNPSVKVVLTDMKMPEMDGLEFIHAARKKFNHLIYIILTGYEISGDLQDALNSGVVDKCFSKPYTMDEVESEIKKLLAEI